MKHLTYTFSIPFLLSLLTACGSVPVPEAHWSWGSTDSAVQVAKREPQEPQEQQALPAPESIGKLPAQVAETAGIPDLKSARAYWRYAVDRLQAGEVDLARMALDAALEISPRNKIAHKLLRQMEIDPVEELGEQYFMHKIAQGESLSRLAKDHLNDSLQFYLLARYNNISNPDEIKIGQEIRIPGVAPKVAAVAVVNKETELLVQARTSYNEENYEQVVSLLSPVFGADAEPGDYSGRDRSAMQKLLVSSYTGLAQNLIEEGQLAHAQDALLSAKAIEPRNSTVKSLQNAVANSKKLDKIYAEAMESRESNPESSQQLLQQIVSVKPDYRDASKQLASLNDEVKGYYYREALKKQRSQQLDSAIVLWDKLLQIEPENENAKLYRARAVELKVNLQKFVSDQ